MSGVASGRASTGGACGAIRAGPSYSFPSRESSVEVGNSNHYYGSTGVLTPSGNSVSIHSGVSGGVHNTSTSNLPKLRYTQPSPDGRRQFLPSQDQHRIEREEDDRRSMGSPRDSRRSQEVLILVNLQSYLAHIS